jgi:ribosomal protein S18 acetylase RimI-like enzyme
MGGTFEIRRAAPGDAAAVAVLFDAYRQFYRREADLVGARRFIGERLERAESVIFLAEEAGTALGFTQLYPSFTSAGMARIFVLNDLFVAPQARGRGIATALLRRAADFGRTEGAVRLALSTATDNHAAQALYRRAGWQRDEAFLVYQLALDRP